MANVKTKKFPYFYTVLALLVLVGVCCVAYGLNLLKSWMTDYEASRPKYVAENVFNQYFADLDVEAFIKEQDYTISPAEDFEDLVKYVQEQIGDGEIKYNEAASGSITGDVLKYVVSAGDYKFAQFTVVDSGEKTEYGNPIYVLGEYDFFYMVEHTSVKVVAPSDATVTVNGFELDSTYVVKTEETESCNHMPSKIMHNDNPVEGIKYSTYYLDGLLYATDDITVTDKYGDPCKVEKNEDGVFVASINYNESVGEQFGATAMAFAQGYAKWAQACGGFGPISKLMDAKSSLYYKVQTLENYFVHSHSKCEFVDEKISEYYEYGDGVVSCRVSFTWNAVRHNGAQATEYIDMTLYFHEVNGEYKIYHMLTHSDFTESE